MEGRTRNTRPHRYLCLPFLAPTVASLPIVVLRLMGTRCTPAQLLVILSIPHHTLMYYALVTLHILWLLSFDRSAPPPV